MSVHQELLRIDEAAATLAISRATLYQLVAAGELRMVKIGRSSRIPHSSVADFVSRRNAEAGKRAGAA
jgi:excisionase family DNA binding protein